jgi:hypothetical protein
LIADVNELTIKLLNWSICSNDWANKEVADVKRDGIIIYNLIIKRAIEIIKIWNRELEIDELTPDIMKGKSTIIQNCFKANKVDENPKWLDKENWYFNDFINLFIKQHVVVENIELAIYIAFPKDSEDLFEEKSHIFWSS